MNACMALVITIATKPSVKSSHAMKIREFKKITTAKGTSVNNRFNEQTMAVHACYNSRYISLPFSVKHQREMTKRCLKNVNNDGFF